MLLLIEFLLVVLALVLALVAPNLGASWFERAEKALSRLARRRGLAVLSVGLLALVLRAALLPILPIPEPAVHDEFGYLLAADTFAHGRLTNPTHPMWVHFETFSVIQRPTYQCFAQPAQGMILAAGKLIFGHPFWGAWLSVGVMCVSICWMLQAWLPESWALVGGLLVVLRFGVFGYWANSYWGGAAGAIGGALVLGALPRIKQLQRARDALLMGTGLAILVNSRPYEGFIFSLPVAASLLLWMASKQRPPVTILLRRVVTPLCLVLALTAVATGYYFWRVTGSPFRTPYAVERQTYAAAPYLLWQPVRSLPTFNHPDLENVYVRGELARFKVASTPLGLIYVSLEKALGFWKFYVGPALTLPLVAMIIFRLMGFPGGAINTETRFLLIVFAITSLGLLSELYFSPHYAAPAAGLVLALLLLTIRRWHSESKPVQLFLSRTVPLICGIMFVGRCFAGPLHIPLSKSNTAGWQEIGGRVVGRAEILQRLNHLPGTQLVIVRYKPHRVPDNEWVYNEPDIDAAKLVWARGMTPAQDEKLIQYFADRQVWILDANNENPHLSQLPPNPMASDMPKREKSGYAHDE